MDIPRVTASLERLPQTVTPLAGASLAQGVQPGTLEIGQQFFVRVLQQISQNHFLIELQGTLVDATGPQALGGRTLLPVVVEQLQPQVVLRVLTQQQGLERLAVQSLRDNLLVRWTTGESMGVLRQALASFVPTADSKAIPQAVLTLHSALQERLPTDAAPSREQIVTLLRDGGINYEAEVARLATENPQALRALPEKDLKGMLMQAHRDVLAARSQSVLERLVDPVAGHLTNIESQQLLNFLAQLHGTPYELQIPLYFGQAPATAYLSIEPDEHWAEGEEDRASAYNILLTLDLDQLGRTRIDGHIGPKTIRVIFYVERADAVGLLNSLLPELAESLHAIGFEKALLTARPLHLLPAEKRQQFEALAAGIPKSVNLINERG
jgi:hypothetical protein